MVAHGLHALSSLRDRGFDLDFGQEEAVLAGVAQLDGVRVFGAKAAIRVQAVRHEVRVARVLTRAGGRV